jgi:hypothetical protein
MGIKMISITGLTSQQEADAQGKNLLSFHQADYRFEGRLCAVSAAG